MDAFKQTFSINMVESILQIHQQLDSSNEGGSGMTSTAIYHGRSLCTNQCSGCVTVQYYFSHGIIGMSSGLVGIMRISANGGVDTLGCFVGKDFCNPFTNWFLECKCF